MSISAASVNNMLQVPKPSVSSGSSSTSSSSKFLINILQQLKPYDGFSKSSFDWFETGYTPKETANGQQFFFSDTSQIENLDTPKDILVPPSSANTLITPTLPATVLSPVPILNCSQSNLVNSLNSEIIRAQQQQHQKSTDLTRFNFSEGISCIFNISK